MKEEEQFADEALLQKLKQLEAKQTEIGSQISDLTERFESHRQNQLRSGWLRSLNQALEFHHDQVMGWARLALEPESDPEELKREFAKMYRVVTQYEYAAQHLLGINPSPFADLRSEEVRARAKIQRDTVPERWQDFQWPEWVPEKVQQEIEEFWGVPGRNPREWIDNAIRNKAPAFGSIAVVSRMKPDVKIAFSDEDYELYPVRYVHAWNNIGRGIYEDGSYTVVSLGFPGQVITEYQK